MMKRVLEFLFNLSQIIVMCEKGKLYLRELEKTSFLVQILWIKFCLLVEKVELGNLI